MSPNAPGHRIRTLVVDDAAVMRRAICAYLRVLPQVEVVGIAEDGRHALEQVDALQPDLVLMDLEMPDLNGLQATSRLKESSPATKVIVITIFDTPAIRRLSVSSGADGFVAKSRLLGEFPIELDRVFASEPPDRASPEEPPG